MRRVRPYDSWLLAEIGLFHVITNVPGWLVLKLGKYTITTFFVKAQCLKVCRLQIGLLHIHRHCLGFSPVHQGGSNTVFAVGFSNPDRINVKPAPENTTHQTANDLSIGRIGK